ncbi:MAG: hypothetical protein MO846_09140 [Candidatus Devosia symbiotica]|nr:hypothetical protein [Candidatus Devosia symbiotica]
MLTGLINGELSMVSPDVSVAAALTLLDASKTINAEVKLAPVNAKQSASIRGDVRALTVNTIKVGAADISASVADLFGVLVIDGAINVSAVLAASVTINILSAREI